MMEFILHTVILLLVFLVRLILIHGADIYITTPETRDYTFLSNHGIRATDRILTFQLEACNNAYVGLMSGSSDAQPLYEIDFGAYGNTVSFIRAGKSSTLPRLDETNGNALDCNIYKEFRITWDDNTINVSHGLENSWSPFLTWTSPTTLWPIQHIGISTAYGAKGKWIFHIQNFPTTSELTPCAASCTKTYTCHCQTTSGTTTSSNTLAQLKIERKTLSSFKRRHQSASDPRKTSIYIGCVGIMVLVLSVASIVILDLLPRA